ncbi:MAG: Lrp/AsnC family transcriptional regulator [Thermococci archaeon]|nr:Lrp/AsnC family transcriptional regulator [Thermococci archaeon]
MIEAFILVVSKPGHEQEIHDALKEHPWVREVYRVYGEYDVVARIEVENIGQLDEFHDNVLRKMKDIEMTETLIASTNVRR